MLPHMLLQIMPWHVFVWHVMICDSILWYYECLLSQPTSTWRTLVFFTYYILFTHVHIQHVRYLFTYLLLVSPYPLPWKAVCSTAQLLVLEALTIRARQKWAMFLRWCLENTRAEKSKMDHALFFEKNRRVFFSQHLQLFHRNLKVACPKDNPSPSQIKPYKGIMNHHEPLVSPYVHDCCSWGQL